MQSTQRTRPLRHRNPISIETPIELSKCSWPEAYLHTIGLTGFNTLQNQWVETFQKLCYSFEFVCVCIYMCIHVLFEPFLFFSCAEVSIHWLQPMFYAQRTKLYVACWPHHPQVTRKDPHIRYKSTKLASGRTGKGREKRRKRSRNNNQIFFLSVLARAIWRLDPSLLLFLVEYQRSVITGYNVMETEIFHIESPESTKQAFRLVFHGMCNESMRRYFWSSSARNLMVHLMCENVFCSPLCSVWITN